MKDATIGKIRKVIGKAFSAGFLQHLYLSFPRVVQQFRDVIVDMEFRVLQMSPGFDPSLVPYLHNFVSRFFFSSGDGKEYLEAFDRFFAFAQH